MKIRNASEKQRQAAKRKAILDLIVERGYIGPVMFKTWKGHVLELWRQGKVEIQEHGKILSKKDVKALQFLGPTFKVIPAQKT